MSGSPQIQKSMPWIWRRMAQNPIAVYCPSFLIDCLETVDEIGTELKEEVEEHGAHAHQVLCLNTDPEWVDGFSHFLKTHVDEGLRGRAELFLSLRRK